MSGVRFFRTDEPHRLARSRFGPWLLSTGDQSVVAGSVAFDGAAAGRSVATAAASGSVAFAGQSVGVAAVAGAVSGSIAFDGSAEGLGGGSVASGSVTFAGLASGRSVARSVVSGNVAFAGVGSGRGVARAGASGAVAFAGAASGRAAAPAAASGTITFSGVALSPDGGSVASGAITFSGAIVGASATRAIASGAVAFSGALVGAGATTHPVNRRQTLNFVRKYGVEATLTRPANEDAGTDEMSVTVHVVSRRYRPNELSNGIVQGDSLIIMSPIEIEDADWPGVDSPRDQRLPVKGDLIVIMGKTQTAITDAEPFYVRGELVRIEMTVRG